MALATLDSRNLRRTTKRIALCIFVVSIVRYILRTDLPVWTLSAALNRGRATNFELEDFDESDIPVQRGSIGLPVEERKLLLDSTSEVPPVICPFVPPNLRGEIIPMYEVSFAPYQDDIIGDNPKVLNGGRFAPTECKTRYTVAIIVPFRNREIQLRVFLSHMHPVWQRQQLNYTVYIVNQAGNGLFNRAKLMNIGVSEARKDREYDCYVFHDTDLLVEDDTCLYRCHHNSPRQIAKYVDVFSYEEISYEIPCNPTTFYYGEVGGFGGASMLTRRQFDAVNGYSNLYWGWGGEDDDMFMRLWKKGYSPENPYGTRCSFSMIKHTRETKNAANPSRYTLLFHATSRMNEEGYSTLRYRVLSVEAEPLYTNVTVDIGTPSRKVKEFMSRKIPWFGFCIAKMPWVV